MSDKIKDFSNWMEDMSFGFENDFLNKDESKLNYLLTQNNIDKCERI